MLCRIDFAGQILTKQKIFRKEIDPIAVLDNYF